MGGAAPCWPTRSRGRCSRAKTGTRLHRCFSVQPPIDCGRRSRGRARPPACRCSAARLAAPRISLLHAQGRSWAEIARFVGQRSSLTADTYTHVLLDPTELDYAGVTEAPERWPARSVELDGGGVRRSARSSARRRARLQATADDTFGPCSRRSTGRRASTRLVRGGAQPRSGTTCSRACASPATASTIMGAGPRAAREPRHAARHPRGDVVADPRAPPGLLVVLGEGRGATHREPLPARRRAVTRSTSSDARRRRRSRHSCPCSRASSERETRSHGAYPGAYPGARKVRLAGAFESRRAHFHPCRHAVSA